jgi:Ca-activated chloride channel homolog
MAIIKLNHSVKYGNEYLNVINETQVFYALMKLTYQLPEGYQRLPINLCLVIDTSTSMKGYALDVVKRTLVNLHQYLSPDDYVSLVVFNDRADTLLRATKIGDFGSLTRYVMRMHAEGGTEIYQGLKRGYVQLVRSPIFRKSTSLLLLLTDGQTYGDDEMCMRLVRSANQEGVIFSAFGLGDEWNDEFLDQLVGYSGGEVTYLSEVGEFGDLLGKYLALSQSIDIPQVVFSFDTHPCVKITSLHRMSAGVTPLLPSGNTFHLGSLRSSRELEFLLELKISPVTGALSRLDMVRGTFSAHNLPGDCELSTENLIFGVPFDLEKKNRNVPDGKVLQSVYHISLYRMQAAARKLIRQGDINTGVNTLKNLARQLAAQGQDALATSVLEESNFIEEHQHYSDSGEKKIKYGTRVLPSVTAPAMRAAPTKKVELK